MQKNIRKTKPTDLDTELEEHVIELSEDEEQTEERPTAGTIINMIHMCQH